jgi:release factor glutamine methyltransferase
LDYLGCKFEVFEQVYKPSDDTYLILDNLKVHENDYLLEIGVGCGIISIFAASKGAHVIGTDISPHAIKCAIHNSKLNNMKNRIDFILSDLFSAIQKRTRFDLIIFNPPYLPADREPDDILKKAWTGGKKGNKMILKFLNKVNEIADRNTRILLIISSLSGEKEIYQSIRENFFEYKVIKKQKFPFEEISLLELKKFEYH